MGVRVLDIDEGSGSIVAASIINRGARQSWGTPPHTTKPGSSSATIARIAAVGRKRASVSAKQPASLDPKYNTPPPATSKRLPERVSAASAALIREWSSSRPRRATRYKLAGG